MSLSNNLYDYKYFFTPLGKKDHMLPIGIKMITRILEDNGFVRVRQVKLANTFSIDLYNHHFSTHKGIKNFGIYQIYEQIKIDSRNEYVPYHELEKLDQMMYSNDMDIAYLGAVMMSKLNPVYNKQFVSNEKLRDGKLSRKIYQMDDPYVIMWWLYKNGCTGAW